MSEMFEKQWPTNPGNGWILERLIVNYKLEMVKEIWAKVKDKKQKKKEKRAKVMKAMKAKKPAKKAMKAMKAKAMKSR